MVMMILISHLLLSDYDDDYLLKTTPDADNEDFVENSCIKPSQTQFKRKTS